MLAKLSFGDMPSQESEPNGWYLLECTFNIYNFQYHNLTRSFIILIITRGVQVLQHLEVLLYSTIKNASKCAWTIKQKRFMDRGCNDIYSCKVWSWTNVCARRNKKKIKPACNRDPWPAPIHMPIYLFFVSSCT